MQHDHGLKKSNFDLLSCSQRRIGGIGVGICGQNICYHVVTFMVPFNLICNMTMSLKKSILTLLPHSIVRGGGGWFCVQNISYRVAEVMIPFNMIPT